MIRTIAIALGCCCSPAAPLPRLCASPASLLAAAPPDQSSPAGCTSPPAPAHSSAIVLAHTCGGVSPHTDAWGKLLASWGYVVVAPDFWGPRGEKSVCGRGNVVNGSMRVGRRGRRDRLPQRPAVRAQGRDRPDRSQPWRMDGGAGRAEDLQSRGARAQGRRRLLPLLFVRSSIATLLCRS